MARLSTGQSYGESTRVSAARLLGGIPTDASGGAIAQGSINAPALQPSAAPVETFQRVGAPTLGGAPQFFAPPKLPEPGQDLANLARSLGGFSTALQGFSDAFLAGKQDQEKKKEAESAAFVGQAFKYGPARGMADLAANLEKAAALGNTDAARMLQIVREKQGSSVGRYFLERSIEQNAISSAALSLPDQIAATGIIQVDGKEVNLADLSSTDPRYLAHRDKLLFGGVQMSTPGYAKNQQLILQAQLQADEVQRKRFNTGQVAKEASQLVVNRGVIVRDYFNGGATTRSVVLFLENNQRQLDYIKSLTIPQEEKTKLTNDWINGVALDLVSVAKDKKSSITNLRSALAPLKMLMTGPIEDRIKKDGTRNESLLLYNTLGGEAYFDQVVAKAQAAQIQDYSQQGQMASMQAQGDYNASRLEAQKAGVLRDPAKAKAYFEQQLKLASEVTDYQSRNALIGTITEDQRAIETAVIKPAQERTAARIANLLTGTENDEAGRNRLSANMDVLLRRNEISTADYEKYKLAIAAQGNKDVRSYDKDIKDRIETRIKDWKTSSRSSNSYGGTNVTEYESNAEYKARYDMLTKSREIVVKAKQEGKDPIEALNKAWATNNWGLREYKDVVRSQPEMYKSSAELINSNTGWFSRNAIGAQAARNLVGQANKRRLYKEAPFAADVDLYLEGRPTENFKTLLKTTSKPSVLILRQLQLHGIDADPAMVDRLKALDDQKISAAPAPRRRTAPQQNNALNGIQIATGAVSRVLNPVQALSSVLAPAAQAQAAPPPVDMSAFFADPGTPPKPVAVATAPKPKPATTFPSRVTEVGYYAGGGGQDGVAGGRTANGEIYNPKKMTVAVQWTLRGKLLNKWLLVQDSKSGKTVRVWANDVGPLVGDEKKTGARHLDLSSAAFTKLFGSTRQGLGRIKYKVDPNQNGRP
jgi:rare lipoprotein A (peptidoglycan hydrolase)